MSDILLVLVGVSSVIAVCLVFAWLERALERSRDRLDKIEEDMYYEQADRDGVEYPPQWRKR